MERGERFETMGWLRAAVSAEPGMAHHSRLNCRAVSCPFVRWTLRPITHRAYGFHSADALIALAMLTVGGLRPPLPAVPKTHGSVSSSEFTWTHLGNSAEP